MNEELLLKLYEKYGLSSKGSFDQFKTDMQDSTIRRKVYDRYLTGKGTFEQFETDLGGQPIQQPQQITQPTEEKSTLDKVNEILPSTSDLPILGGFTETLYKAPGELAKVAGIGEHYISKLLSKVGIEKEKPIQETTFYKAGSDWEKYIDDTLQVDPTIKDKFTYQLGSGLGTMTEMFLTGGSSLTKQGLVGGAKVATKGAFRETAEELGKRIVSPTGIVAGSFAVPEFEAAKEAGMSDDEAFQVFLKNYLVNQTDAIPIEKALTRLNVLFKGTLAQKVKSIGEGGLIEGLQEGIQTWMANKVAQESYDPERDELFGVLDSMSVGGVLGMLLPAFGSAVNPKVQAKVKQLEQKAITLDQAEKQANQMQSGVPEVDVEIQKAATLSPQEQDALTLKKETEISQENAETVRSDEGQVSEGGTTAQESQSESSSNIQQQAQEQTSEQKVEIVESPEYQEAVKKVSELQDAFSKLSIEENADELYKKLQEARAAALKIKGEVVSKAKKTETQKKIEESVGIKKPETVTMKLSDAIAKQFKDVTKGLQQGVKIGQEESNKLITKVQEVMKNYNLSPRQEQAILNRAKRVNPSAYGTAKNSVMNFNSFVDRVANDADYADNLSKARELNKKLRKLSKRQGNEAPNINISNAAKQFATIDPENTSIREHLLKGEQLLSALTNPSAKNYSMADIDSINEYTQKVKAQEAEYQQEVEKQEEKEQPDEPVVVKQLRVNLRAALQELSQKDTTNLDPEEKKVVENIKKINPEKLTKQQLVQAIRVADNITVNDDFSGAAFVERAAKVNENWNKIKDLIGKSRVYKIGGIGKTFAERSLFIKTMFNNSKVASEIGRLLGLQDYFAKGAQTDTVINKVSDKYYKEVKKFEKKQGSSFADPKNQVIAYVHSLFVKHPEGSTDQEITNNIEVIKKNIQKTIDGYRSFRSGYNYNVVADAYESALSSYKDVTSIEDANNVLDTKYPDFRPMFDFFVNMHSSPVDYTTPVSAKEGLKKLSEARNESFTSQQNYTTTEQISLPNYKLPINDDSDINNRSLKSQKASTTLEYSQKLGNNRIYGYDFTGAQMRGFEESVRSIKTSEGQDLMNDMLMSPDFVETFGKDNAEALVQYMKNAKDVQEGMSSVPKDAVVDALDIVASLARSLGTAKVLGSTVSQLSKQTVSILTKAFVHHSSNPLRLAIGIRKGVVPSDNLKKLFDQYQVGLVSHKAGSLDRAGRVSNKLKAQSLKFFGRLGERVSNVLDRTTRGSLITLTSADAAMKRSTWVSYYLESLAKQGIKAVDLETEYSKQGEESRQVAAAYAEQMVSETQTAPNPAEGARISTHDSNKAATIVKNVVIPYTKFSITARRRLYQNIQTLVRNPSRDAAKDVAGDIIEIATYATVVTYALAPYKDFLKDMWRDVYDLDEPEEEEEEIVKRKVKTGFAGQIVNQSVPLPLVGQVGDYLTTNGGNQLMFALREDPELTYNEWKKQGYAPFYDKELDYGILGIGGETTYDLGSDVIDLTSLIVNEDPVVNISGGKWGGSTPVEFDEIDKAMFKNKVLFDMLSQVGINEADLFNSFKAVYKERMKEAKKNRKVE